MPQPLAAISPLVLRLRLAALVDKVMTDAGYSQLGLALAWGGSRQTVNRLVNPLSNLDRRPLAPHVQAILRTCGLTPGEPLWDEILTIFLSSSEDGWWRARQHAAMGRAQMLLADIELGAARISDYRMHLAPQLAQTADVAAHRAGLQPADDQSTPHGITAGIARRQQQLATQGTRHDILLEETAVRRQVVPADLHRRQLQHLADIADTDRTQVRILPAGAALPDLPPAVAPFTLYTYPGRISPELAMVQAAHLDGLLADETAVRHYDDLHAQLRDAALPAADSAALLADAAAAIRD